MSLHDFWTNVRMGAGLIGPRDFADAPQLDASDLTNRLREATPWLTPRSVDGFDAADFSFLPESERTRVSKCVTDFQGVAANVNPTTPASKAAVDKALPLFLEIIQTLGLDRYEDEEAYRLGKLIERTIEPYRPPELAYLRFRAARDHTGDPGLWIWAFLSDDPARTDDQFLEAAHQLRKLIAPVARRIAPDRYPYIAIRELSELNEPMEAL